MGFSLIRFIKNPKHSIEKTNALFGTYFFKRYVKKSLSSINNPKFNHINLNAMFTDDRDSYNSVIEKIRFIATNILSMIDLLSDRYNFNYFLAYGTLLGAIRHNDFIPWDDDIDIMMTKDDLKKLISVSHLLPDYLEVKVMANNFIKIMDKNSKISLDGKRGVAVDIFIVDKRDHNYCFKNVHNNRWIITPYKDWLPATKHYFGNYHFSIPANYKEILTLIYGDYMKLPPEEDRVYPHIDLDKIII